jgi:phosphoribosylamine--glycine ligase
MTNVLLLGSGGREHTLAWKIAQSQLLNQLYIAPGNAGTSHSGTNVNLNLSDFDSIKQFALDMKIDMIIVGPEQPLVDGIYDYFKGNEATKNVTIVGMSKEAAQLEGSKNYAKAFMQRNKIPTAAFGCYTSKNIEEGYQFLDSLKAPYVLKADGLAAGKGVLIINDLNEAKASLKEILIDNKFGEAGNQVVIEEFLQGIELSVFVLTDGIDYLILPEAKDYKRIGEGDTGLNTGGMGSISPVPFADQAFMKKVEDRIIIPTVEGLNKEGLAYNGFVFIGLMNVNGDPMVIEYNVRMGDPETESVIPRIKSDLLEVLIQMGNHKIGKTQLDIDPRFAASVMLVSGGYPEVYQKGKTILGLDKINKSIAFHAGTSQVETGEIVSAGGRVLAITSYGNTLQEALDKSYESAKLIKFEGVYYRTDLGQDLLK